MILKPKYKKVLFISDVHAPFDDMKAVNAMCSFSKWWKPDILIFIGDVVDFYDISHFIKNPERRFKLQAEINSAKSVIKEICATAPKSKRYFIRGNHEARLEKYLWTQAPELSGLDSLHLEKLLGFDDLGIEYVRTGRMKFHGMMIKHGDLVRKFAVYTAKAEYENTKMSGVSGHTHRIGTYSETNESGEYCWLEIGCLCKLDQEYMEGKMPNWQQGFGIGYYKENSNRFNIDVIRIINGKAMFGGMEFS